MTNPALWREYSDDHPVPLLLIYPVTGLPSGVEKEDTPLRGAAHEGRENGVCNSGYTTPALRPDVPGGAPPHRSASPPPLATDWPEPSDLHGHGGRSASTAPSAPTEECPIEDGRCEPRAETGPPPSVDRTAEAVELTWIDRSLTVGRARPKRRWGRRAARLPPPDIEHVFGHAAQAGMQVAA